MAAVAAPQVNKPFRIGLIIGSTRVNRIGPEVADFILDTLALHQDKIQSSVVIDRIDLKEYNLPMYNEPGIPRQILDPNLYVHQLSRDWSARISACDAFIFLSAQRNWGIPAELKNAIDYLYYEWTLKPALLITYGGHGGEQCADALRTVLGAMGVNVLKTMVNMHLPRPEGLMKAFRGEKLELNAKSDASLWAEHCVQFSAAFDEVVGTLNAAEESGVIDVVKA